MSAIVINAFAAERPAVTPRLLETPFAQVARLAKVQTGDLEAWRGRLAVLTVGNDANTIYQHRIGDGPVWGYFTDSQLAPGAVSVDVAKGPILGDTFDRTYYSGLQYPAFSTYASATTPVPGSSHVPYTVYRLGVPAPTVKPDVDVSTSPATTVEYAELLNPGAEDDTDEWDVEQGDLGIFESGDVAGFSAHGGTKFFYGGDIAAETTATQTYPIDDLYIAQGNKITLHSWHASGTNGSAGSVRIEFYDAGNFLVGTVGEPDAAVVPALTWQERVVEGDVPQTAVTAKIVMHFLRVGMGVNDHYIDDIALDITRTTGTLYDGTNSLYTDGWAFDGNSYFAGAGGDNGYGLPPPCYAFNTGNNGFGSISKDFKLLQCAKAVVEFDVQQRRSKNWHWVCLTLAGVGFSITNNGVRLNGDTGGGGTELVPGNYDNTDSHHKFVLTKTGETTADVEVTSYRLDNAGAPATAKASISMTNGGISFAWQEFMSGGLDNIAINVTSPTPSKRDAENLLANYVYTWVNEWAEESAPSPVSRTIQRTDEASILVTSDDTPPAGWNIVKKRLYRSAGQGSDAQFFRVAETDATAAEFVDAIDDADLGEALESQLYEVPPSDLRGLIALPNGVMAGFRQGKNEICFSVPNRPHAWPVAWRAVTEYPVVGIEAMDTDLVIGTQTHPYIVNCADPSVASAGMGKMEKRQGCVSKRSMTTLEGAGVVYASPDGITAVQRGGIDVITAGLFTRDQWQALKPESIRAAVHDGALWFFWNNGTQSGGYVMDLRSRSLSRLDFFARGAFANPLTDRLYLIVGSSIVEWEGAPGKATYEWVSKLFVLPRPTSFEAAIVRSQGTEPVTMRLYADGNPLPFFERAIGANVEFNLPAVRCEDSIEIKLEGTRRVRSVAIAEMMEELP